MNINSRKVRSLGVHRRFRSSSTKRHRASFWTISLTTSMMLVLAACASPAPNGTESSSGPPAVAKLSIGLPGIPPIFATTIAYVAQAKGYFSSRGLDVELKPMASSGDIGQAIVSGQLSGGFMGTTPAIALVSAGSSVVGIYGIPVSSLQLITTDPDVKTCKDVAGKSIAVDPVGAPKSTALIALIESCGLTEDDVDAVHIGSNAQTDAVLSGQVKIGVLHIDEVATLASKGAAPRVLEAMSEIAPLAHLQTFVVPTETLESAEKRDHFVKFLAAFSEAFAFMNEPGNAEEVSSIASDATKFSTDVTLPALKEFLSIGYWPKDEGLPKAGIEFEINSQIKAGNIKESEAPTYERFTDKSVFADSANK